MGLTDESKEGIIFDGDEPEEVEESSVEDLSKIVSYNVSNTVEVLKLKIDNGEIDLRPEFQRDFVWDIGRASLFIDSLLIGLPIPSIFLGKNKEDESFIVIDGQQRLKSVYYFMTGQFVSNGKATTFSLRNLKDRVWNGESYSGLDGKLQRRICNSVLNTTIIEDINLRPRVVHDLFHRLNTGGMPLTDQEIRNCVYSGSFNKFLMELNLDIMWRELLGGQIPDKRLRDVELILRFFALFSNLLNYRPSMREFLSTYQSDNQNNAAIEKATKDVFEKTVDIILNQIGKNAFKLTTTINKSVCDSLMVSIAQLLKEGKQPNKLKENYSRLIENGDYRRYVSSGTTSQKNVNGRIELARRYFLELV